MRLSTIPCLLFFALTASGQIKDSLLLYADIMRHAAVPEHRTWAAEHFEEHFTIALNHDMDFEQDFSAIEDWVMFLYAPDSTFRIITWQVNNERGKTYQGFIQERGEIPLTLLVAEQDIWDTEYSTLSRDEWLGFLYYDMLRDDNDDIILFGFSDRNDGTFLKVAEPLTKRNGDWYLGGEIFHVDEDPVRPHIKSRILLSYSDQATARLAYDRSADIIVFDHLIPVQGLSSDGVAMVPDGSYSAFRMEEGRWLFVEKLFDQTSEEPPMDGKPREEKRDLFGNPISK